LCVEDAVALVGWLGRDRVDLLGFSYGGQLAMIFAERYPELIDPLVLASTTAYPDIEGYLATNEEYLRRVPESEAAGRHYGRASATGHCRPRASHHGQSDRKPWAAGAVTSSRRRAD
jgi:pimeloyl-ACP methyl ester carboxylesterase